MAHQTTSKSVPGSPQSFATIGTLNVREIEVVGKCYGVPELVVEWLDGLITTCRVLRVKINHARPNAANLSEGPLKEAFVPNS